MVQSVRIFPGVLSHIISRAAQVGRTEIGGFLIGRIRGTRLLVTRATYPRQVGSATHVAINDIDMALLAEQLAEQGSGEVIIGWWHTHPGLGAHFLSGTDVSTQRRYQSFFPLSIALVIDSLKFSQTLKLSDLDLRIYRLDNGDVKDLDYTFVRDPKVIIPDFYRLLLQLDTPTHLVLEDTWFERMLREIFGERITTEEYTQEVGRFFEAMVTFTTVGALLLIVLLSLVALVS